jgi:hypothetical protein
MGWLDVAVALLLATFWIAVAVIILLDEAEWIHAGLVLILGAWTVLYWTRTSWTLETLRAWRQRRRE